MKLEVKSVNAEFINSDRDYTVMKLMGSPTLVYGDGESKSKKARKAIVFKNTKVLREVATMLLTFANVFDYNEGKNDE